MPLHRKLIVVAGKNANLAILLNLDLVVANGFSKGQQRTPLNSRVSLVRVVARHDERAFTGFGEGTGVQALIELLSNFFGSLLIVFKPPLLGIIKRNFLVNTRQGSSSKPHL